jgi:hypothetical protein
MIHCCPSIRKLLSNCRSEMESNSGLLGAKLQRSEKWSWQGCNHLGVQSHHSQGRRVRSSRTDMLASPFPRKASPVLHASKSRPQESHSAVALLPISKHDIGHLSVRVCVSLVIDTNIQRRWPKGHGWTSLWVTSIKLTFSPRSSCFSSVSPPPAFKILGLIPQHWPRPFPSTSLKIHCAQSTYYPTLFVTQQKKIS